jgi:hypothetical protein
MKMTAFTSAIAVLMGTLASPWLAIEVSARPGPNLALHPIVQAGAGLATVGASGPTAESTLITPDTSAFLTSLAKATVEACAVAPGTGGNTLPFAAICPGGRGCYPAIWIQDFTMIYSSGLVPREEGLAHFRLMLQCQNGEKARALRSGALIPAYAIPDHIDLNGEPVFFPGTYSSGDDQGGEPWGILPPTNNHYDVIWLAHMLAQSGNSRELLTSEINGKRVYDRLKLAFNVPETDPATGLVHTTPEHRAVGFIFCDSIYMTGDLLMASLLRMRAANHMALFADTLGKKQDARDFREIALHIKAHIVPIFADVPRYGGWLKASTGVSAQPDVWGTIYAVYSGALQGEARQRSLKTIVQAIAEGQIEFEGGLRQVPLAYDASKTSAWEKTPTPKNRYQNGAYWHMPTGWLVAALQHDYPQTARAVLGRYVAHMRENAFTRGKGFGAPWECFGWDGKANQNPIFGPSITMLYGILVKGGQRRPLM